MTIRTKNILRSFFNVDISKTRQTHALIQLQAFIDQNEQKTQLANDKAKRMRMLRADAIVNGWKEAAQVRNDRADAIVASWNS